MFKERCINASRSHFTQLSINVDLAALIEDCNPADMQVMSDEAQNKIRVSTRNGHVLANGSVLKRIC